jgi:hypothetical protein
MCFSYSCVLGILPFKDASDLILQNKIQYEYFYIDSTNI